jgi:hypothetical protein
MKYIIVLPSIHQPYTDDCLLSMSEEVRKNVFIVDNTQHNIGVTPAWNQGIDRMYDEDADWLILLSAAIRFTNGGDDFISELEKRQYQDVLEATGVYGWHLIAFNRRIFDRVGRFDENLPIYFSDLDWSLRIQKAYGQENAPWDKIEIGVVDMGMAHGVKLAGVIEPADPKIMYFVGKWGRHPGAWKLGSYDTPFDDPANDIKYFPKVNFIGVGL